MRAARKAYAGLVAALAISATAARAQVPPVGPVILAEPGSLVLNYTTPVMVAEVDGPLTFVNLDLLATHNVTQNVAADGFGGPDDNPWCLDAQGQPTVYGPGKCPAFITSTIGPASAAQVLGVDRLVAGKTYSFYCTIHPTTMTGKLVVLPAGSLPLP